MKILTSIKGLVRTSSRTKFLVATEVRWKIVLIIVKQSKIVQEKKVASHWISLGPNKIFCIIDLISSLLVHNLSAAFGAHAGPQKHLLRKNKDNRIASSVHKSEESLACDEWGKYKNLTDRLTGAGARNIWIFKETSSKAQWSRETSASALSRNTILNVNSRQYQAVVKLTQSYGHFPF